ncbi:hypothetical protein BBJ28_00015102 [Nothophytophthora sp. Chile5]|nr:hypothetical protein BBJ28_00015102 [Nothophytophthora sp. Chile5]
MVAIATVQGVHAVDGNCVQPQWNTLTSDCYGACGSALCVSYAPASAQNTSMSSQDGNYYYRGCEFARMPSCHTNVTAGDCELQCLEEETADAVEWTLGVAQPQSDKADTALFQIVQDLTLPATLQNLTIVGDTESSQFTFPLFFSSDAFTSGSALTQITITDVSIRDITTNIFPDSLLTLDLSDNALTDIPAIIYEMRNLSTLHLQGNAITDAHVTAPQLQYLQALAVFEANLTVNGSCSTGYDAVSWADKSVCYTTGNGLGSISDSGSNEKSTSSSASDEHYGSAALFAILGVILFTVLAVIGGVLFLRRWKRKAATQQQRDSAVSPDGKLKSSMRNLRARLAATTSTVQTTELEVSLNESGNGRKAAFQEIPMDDVAVLSVLVTTGAVSVALAEYRARLVLVTKLQTSADDVEAALDMVPTLSQLRHPQLLSITGLMWDDRHAMTAVCEYMTLGTLEAFLRSSGPELTWKNFKMNAAAQIARGLMYLHSQHRITYDGLNGKSVFVDADKGCKLNPLLAALPSDETSAPLGSRSYLHRSDSATKAFFAPEILIGERSRSSSDMYAFGVLLAHLDTRQSADEMIRTSWRLRTTHLGAFDSTSNDTLLSSNDTTLSNDLDASRRRTVQLEDMRALESSHGFESSRTLNSSRSLQALESSRRQTTPQMHTQMEEDHSTSFMNMFTFTPECPATIKELAGACLQYDPSLRPSASYIAAMLHS